MKKNDEAKTGTLDIGTLGDATAFEVCRSKMAVRIELNTSEPERLVRAFAGLVPKKDRAPFAAAAKLLGKNARASTLRVPVGVGNISLG